jgi:hypothetical protein
MMTIEERQFIIKVINKLDTIIELLKDIKQKQ